MQNHTDMNRKRKRQPHQKPKPDELDDSLALTLSPPSRCPRQLMPPLSQLPLPSLPSSFLCRPPENSPRPFRTRRNPSQAPRADKEVHISPPFPWATDCRASVHSLESLFAAGIRKISGEVSCKRCDGRDVMEFDLQDKFSELCLFFVSNKMFMHDRAPKQWMCPKLMDCRICRQPDCVRPVLSTKKRGINWLFLLLSQTLGCCTLRQLKYFCKHTGNHRTGAKDRVLYLTYLGLCKQLDQNGPFDR